MGVVGDGRSGCSVAETRQDFGDRRQFLDSNGFQLSPDGDNRPRATPSPGQACTPTVGAGATAPPRALGCRALPGGRSCVGGRPGGLAWSGRIASRSRQILLGMENRVKVGYPIGNAFVAGLAHERSVSPRKQRHAPLNPAGSGSARPSLRFSLYVADP